MSPSPEPAERVGGATPARLQLLVGGFLALAVVGALVAVTGVLTRDEQASGLSPAFTYDLEDLRRTDPELVRYEEVGGVRLPCRHAFGIAVGPADRLYVAGDESVHIFSQDGNHRAEIGVGPTPRCLAVAPDGALYVGVRDHIEVYEESGVRRATWDSPGVAAVITSVAVSGVDVFVADAGNRVVWRYRESGELLHSIGEKDDERSIPGFIVPSPFFDLAVAPDGLLRVVNPGRHRIEAYTLDGYLELWWGRVSMGIEGFAGCGNPVNFALLPDGRFATCEKGLPRVKIYAAGGEFQSVVAGPEHFAAYAYDGVSSDRRGELDVAVDSRGRILVLDPVARLVRIFAEKADMPRAGRGSR